MKTLNILQYQDYKLYFQDFLAENKALDPKYSQRYFAQKLNWPVSLFNDLIGQRKLLTLNRCLEFCSFVGFDEQQTSYFIFLCMSAASKGQLKDFIDNTLIPKVSPHPKFIRQRGFVTVDQKLHRELESRIIGLERYLKELETDSLPKKNKDLITYHYEFVVSEDQ